MGAGHGFGTPVIRCGLVNTRSNKIFQYYVTCGLAEHATSYINFDACGKSNVYFRLVKNRSRLARKDRTPPPRFRPGGQQKQEQNKTRVS